MIALRGRMLELQKIRDAQELTDYSDEHRKRMLERLTGMFVPQVVSHENEDAA
jgi:hypothetical protein